MSKGFVYTINNKNKFREDTDKTVYNIKNVLLTKVGTRPCLPNFGSKLYTLEYYPLDQILVDLACVYIREAIANSIDNIVITSIRTKVDKSNRTVTFNIVFKQQNGIMSTLALNYNGEKFY